MSAFPIRNDADHERALARIEALWGAAPGSPDGNELEILVALAEAYEDKRSTLLPSDPIEVIRYKLDELGMSQRELGRRLGWGTGRTSEILNRKRPLTLGIIRQVAAELGIPPATLLGEQSRDRSSASGTLTLHADILAKADEAAAAAGATVTEWVEAAIIRALACLTVAHTGRDAVVTSLALAATSAQAFASTTAEFAGSGALTGDITEERQAA